MVFASVAIISSFSRVLADASDDSTNDECNCDREERLKRVIPNSSAGSHFRESELRSFAFARLFAPVNIVTAQTTTRLGFGMEVAACRCLRFYPGQKLVKGGC